VYGFDAQFVRHVQLHAQTGIDAGEDSQWPFLHHTFLPTESNEKSHK
jgi:hypothetical protein